MIPSTLNKMGEMFSDLALEKQEENMLNIVKENKQHLVAYIVNEGGNPGNDRYEVFIDYDDNKLAAQIFYEKLLLDENTYSANMCEILNSTDY